MDTNTTPTLEERLEKLRVHLVVYRRDYAIAGVSALAGAYLYKKLHKVDDAVVVAEWMDRMARRGHSLFAMNPQEREVWDASIQYISGLASYRKTGMETARKEFVNDLRADAAYYGGK